MKVRVDRVYSFRYSKPKGKENRTLAAFDAAPLLIPFGIKDGFLIGVNLHWIKASERKKTFKFIINRYERMGEEGVANEKIPLLLYRDMQILKSLKPALKAIRKYFVEGKHKITKFTEIDPKDYDKIFKPKYRARFKYRKKNYKDAKLK